jgi:hypothetical protein
LAHEYKMTVITNPFSFHGCSPMASSPGTVTCGLKGLSGPDRLAVPLKESFLSGCLVSLMPCHMGSSIIKIASGLAANGEQKTQQPDGDCRDTQVWTFRHGS